MLKIDMGTECWFCHRKIKDLIPLMSKLLENDIEKEVELKRKHPEPLHELLHSHEDILELLG